MPTSPTHAVLEALSRDSRVHGGGSDAISFLMNLLYFGDFSVLEQVSSGEAHERVNLIGHKGPATGTPLVLASTIATSLEPVPALWPSLEGNGLAARRTGDRIFGLGANGGKVDAVLKILAGATFRPEELKRPLFIFAMSGEEAHGSGARSIIENLGTPGKCVVHAPTNLRVWTDHPGCISLRLTLTRRIRHRRMPPHAGFFEIRVQGRSAHALMPDASPSDDALARGLEVLDTLRRHGDVRVLSIDAGEAANRVPGHCVLRVATSFERLPPMGSSVEASPIADGTALPFPIDALVNGWLTARDAGLGAIESRLGHMRNAPTARPTRPTWTGRLASDRDAITGSIMLWTGPGVDTSDLCERFAQAVQNALVGQEEIEIQIDVVQDRPAFSGSEGSESFLTTVEHALQASSVPREIGGGTFTSDAGVFRAQGFDTAVFGPGSMDALYRDDESISVRNLEAACTFYENLIRLHCLAK